MSREMQDDLIRTLNEIEYPELDIGIIDLGLVYRADWNANSIEVELVNTPAFDEVLLNSVNGILHERFGGVASISVQRGLDAPWSPDRLSGTARRQLGWERALTARTVTGRRE